MQITRKAATAIVTITFSLFAFSVAPADAGIQPFQNPAINGLNSNQYLSELRRLAPKVFAQMTKPSLVLVGKDACKIFNANNGTGAAFLDTKNALIEQGWNPKMARSIALAATKYLCNGEAPESSPVLTGQSAFMATWRTTPGVDTRKASDGEILQAGNSICAIFDKYGYTKAVYINIGNEFLKASAGAVTFENTTAIIESALKNLCAGNNGGGSSNPVPNPPRQPAETLVTMPAIVGMFNKDAERKVSSVGLSIFINKSGGGNQSVSAPFNNDCIVTSQSPAAGTQIKQGSITRATMRCPDAGYQAPAPPQPYSG